MAGIRTFRDLDAWKVGMNVVELVYRLTSGFPDTERYGLTAQMRRASVSVPSNVAEGNAMNQPRWTLRFLRTAIGSSCELETQVEVALRLKFCAPPDVNELVSALDRLQKLLYGMKREREVRLLTAGGVFTLAFLLFTQVAS